MNAGCNLIGATLSAGVTATFELSAVACRCFNDLIIGPEAGGVWSGSFIQSGAVFIDTNTLVMDGQNSCSGGIFYGTGRINVGQAGQGGALQYGPASAVNTFRNSGGLQLNSLSTGYSLSTLGGAGGVTTMHGAIVLTPLALDTAAGSTGFGGYAFGGGAAITNGSQP
jgi:hypothetical protein